ncbi:uncharacterized protein B0P05DRAFT_473950 [Gilbertella persicaria]|uniref:uncharacterized protein n=1 Tax=Gilbertella persicaria TaxID=101096 RepID=UPI002220FB68|nr:uncharacterized protein B0P05DRAFT_473950 [Gilbertella persicaria]KAI8071193.1 hypothetical protein B0P05DRAFT_473950 [Gilbertella persicaria]
MSMNNSFCFDTIYSISTRGEEVLYSLVVRDSKTQGVYPVAFLIANDKTVGPLSQ